MTFFYWRLLLITATTIYHLIACVWEQRSPPPGQRVDVGGYRLHCVTAGSGDVTIVLDHSLGGVEGYLLLDELAQLTRVCIYDRAGYGWSDRSPYPRTSDQIVQELDRLLTQAELTPPYVLVGDSFGSYNMRLYAHRFPDKVVGVVLTDGLHEDAMLTLPWSLQVLKGVFASGFVMSVLGSSLGLIRLLRLVGVFGWLKPELRRFPQPAVRCVTRSFCRPKHWVTMTQEILGLDASARQVRVTQDLGDLPLVSIKARSFFLPSGLTRLMPLAAANRVRDRMHAQLVQLSSRCVQLTADRSGHFVWVDQPEVIVQAVEQVLGMVRADGRHDAANDESAC